MANAQSASMSPTEATSTSAPIPYYVEDLPSLNAATQTEKATSNEVVTHADQAPSSEEQWATTNDVSAQTVLDNYQQQLAPYGQWLDEPSYGLIWVPSPDVVGSNFAPYVSQGHWALDLDDNWAWVSDYSFGSIVFHYGRWVQIDTVGWAWVAGFTYAPAWVQWRVPVGDYAYVGWAATPPTYGWFDSGVVTFVASYRVSYVFCPSNSVFAPQVSEQVVRDRYVTNTAVRHSFRYSATPTPGQPYVSPSVSRVHVPPTAVPIHRIAATPQPLPRLRASGTSTGSNRYDPNPIQSPQVFDAAVSRLRHSVTLGTYSSNGALLRNQPTATPWSLPRANAFSERRVPSTDSSTFRSVTAGNRRNAVFHFRPSYSPGATAPSPTEPFVRRGATPVSTSPNPLSVVRASSENTGTTLRSVPQVNHENVSTNGFPMGSTYDTTRQSGRLRSVPVTVSSSLPVYSIPSTTRNDAVTRPTPSRAATPISVSTPRATTPTPMVAPRSAPPAIPVGLSRSFASNGPSNRNPTPRLPSIPTGTVHGNSGHNSRRR
jgi:hypothetical protein